MANDKNSLLDNKKVLQYPLGLGSTRTDDYNNDTQYMMFKINTSEKASKLAGDEKNTKPVVVTNSRTGVGVKTENFVKSNFKDADPDLNTQFTDDAAKKETWRYQKGMVRLDKVIILPMPNMHNVSTSIQYTQNFEPSLLTKAGDMYNQLGSGVTSELMTYTKNAAGAAAINKLAGMLGAGNATSANALLAEDRLAMNPKKEVLFESFGYRQFSFQYNFAPKSLEESNMVNEIIKTFRYYALPEIVQSKLFYMLPAEFEVGFMLGKLHNPNIPRITTSVLQRVSVNYSPNHGVWASLPNGAPLAIDMTLDFLEMELVDRNRVWQDGHPITSGF